MPAENDVIGPAIGEGTIQAQEDALAHRTKPYKFQLRAQLLEQGRTDTVLAATNNLTARIKVYASGGENELHAHPHEDHLFIILQGRAQFCGPSDQSVELGRHDGFMIPKGNLYSFTAISDEPLVLFRIGSPAKAHQGQPSRISRRGEQMSGESRENKTVPIMFREGANFE